jgi:hypothetical protein
MSLIALAVTCCTGGKMEPGNTTVSSIKNVSAEAWQRLSQKRIYFGHQSVGSNIVDGIKEVMKENPQIKLHIVETNNPSDFNAPTFAHSAIGKNTDPKSKIDAFADYMDTGLGNAVHISFFKFCYIDILRNADVNKIFEEYKGTLLSLRTKYPHTTFVHITAPLRTVQTGPRAWIKKIISKPIGGYDDNINRQQFNDKLRKEYSGKEPIFDLATIESTNPDGSRLSFTQDGKIGYALVPEYTDDGGHFNKRGRKIVAEQFLIFLSKL